MLRPRSRNSSPSTDRFRLVVVDADPHRKHTIPLMHKLVCVGRSRWPAAWERLADSQFDRLVDCADTRALIAELSADRTAVGLVFVDPVGAQRLVDAVEDVDAVVRARLVVALDCDGVPAKLMASARVADFVTLIAPWAEVAYRLQLCLYASYTTLFNRRRTHLADDGHAPPAPALLAPLTPKEHELYMLLARHLGEPVRRADILRTVWDKDPRMDVSSNIVDVYILYLRQKLELAAPHLEIATIRRVGYALRERAQVQSDVSAPPRTQSEAPLSTTRPAS